MQTHGHMEGVLEGRWAGVWVCADLSEVTLEKNAVGNSLEALLATWRVLALAFRLNGTPT